MQLVKVILFAAAASAASFPGLVPGPLTHHSVFKRATNPSQVAIANSDCGNFLQNTSIVPSSIPTVTQTSTVTQEGILPKRDESIKTVPVYASACSGTALYSAACSCWGITAATKTIPSGVDRNSQVSPPCSSTALPAGSTLTALGSAILKVNSAPENGYGLSFGFDGMTPRSPGYIQGQLTPERYFAEKKAFYQVSGYNYGFLYHVDSGLCDTIFQTSAASLIFDNGAITLEICDTCARSRSQNSLSSRCGFQRAIVVSLLTAIVTCLSMAWI